MERKYSANGYTLIIDFELNEQVYFRKFKGDELLGLYRLTEAIFRQQLEQELLEYEVQHG